MATTTNKLDNPFPQQLGDFEVIRKIGEGGMGAVYEGIQKRLNRRVAIKVLSHRLASDGEFLKRFQREAQATASINHPNLIQIFDFGEEDGIHFYAMEYAEGKNLSELLKQAGKLELKLALDAAIKVAGALRYAHSLGIIHRDIKPDNIMLTNSGQIKLADLGLAKRLDDDSALTMTGMGLGSPHYMAPEQAHDARRVDHRADIYALGITLLTLVSGRRPFRGKSPFALVKEHEQTPLPSGAKLGTLLPPVLEVIIQKMAAKNPENRYQDYDGLLTDLETARAEIIANSGPSPGRDAVRPKTAPGMIVSRQRESSSASSIPPGSTPEFDTDPTVIEELASEKIFRNAIIGVTVILLAYLVIDFAKDHRLTSPAVSTFTNAPPIRKMGGAIVTASEQTESGTDETPQSSSGIPQSVVGILFPAMDAPKIFYLPMGIPPRPSNKRLLAATAPRSMIPEAIEYATANEKDLRGILQRFFQIYRIAQDSALRDHALEQINFWATRMELAIDLAIKDHTARMKSLLAENKPKEAYDVWKKFPSDLHTFKYEKRIYDIIRTNIPTEHLPKTFGTADSSTGRK